LRGLYFGNWFDGGSGDNRSGLLNNGSGLELRLGFGLGRFRFNRGDFGDGFGFYGFGGLGGRDFLWKCRHNLGSCRLPKHASPGLDLGSNGLHGLGGDGLFNRNGLLFEAVGRVVFVCGGFFGRHRQRLVFLGSRSVGGMSRSSTSTTATPVGSSASATSCVGSITSTTSSSSAGWQVSVDGCGGCVLGLGASGLLRLGDFAPLGDGA
jgi:hypothetical protein